MTGPLMVEKMDSLKERQLGIKMEIPKDSYYVKMTVHLKVSWTNNFQVT